jgi:histone acetyltransferase 1
VNQPLSSHVESRQHANLTIAAFDKSSTFDLNINDDIYKDWKPPGELLRTLTASDSTYEIWKGSLADKAVQQMVKRIQILIPLFIEGGQAINPNDPEWSLQRWTVFLLYKKSTEIDTSSGSPYVFMGYSTVYRYYHYQLPTPPSSPPSKKLPLPTAQPVHHEFQFPLSDTSKSELPCRSRISQFLILPPFHGGGNGSRFYESIFDFYLSTPQTVEITVEDPNETFDDLRDLNDLKRLRTMPEFTGLRIRTDVTIPKKGRVPTGKIVDLLAIESLRRKMKIAPRQFMRLVEMQLLSLIPTYVRKSLLHELKKGTAAELKAREHEYHLWQLFVKQRLYRHNKDTLIQLDRAERIDKLDDALSAVEADYGRLLRTLDQRQEKSATGNGEGNGKRAADEEIDDGGPSSKKVKVTEE